LINDRLQGVDLAFKALIWGNGGKRSLINDRLHGVDSASKSTLALTRRGNVDQRRYHANARGAFTYDSAI
jgi:hypothetical protein